MILAIIQARMGSSRLPGKVLMNIKNKPLLKFMVDRVKMSRLVNKIVIATTVDSEDNPIVDFCETNNILYYRGSVDDVLDRYFKVAKKYSAKTIVRLTGDCPLCDPNLIDQTINLFNDMKVDYASNTVPPEIKKYPDGTDVEVFNFKSLKKAWTETKDIKDREHVTFYFWKRNKEFTLALLDNKNNWGKYRITVDYKKDLDVVREIVNELEKKNKFGYVEEIVEILEKKPNIKKINSMYRYGMNW